MPNMMSWDPVDDVIHKRAHSELHLKIERPRNKVPSRRIPLPRTRKLLVGRKAIEYAIEHYKKVSIEMRRFADGIVSIETYEPHEQFVTMHKDDPVESFFFIDTAKLLNRPFVFDVIYAVTGSQDINLRLYLPNQRRLFYTTEDDRTFDDEEMFGARGKHRKLVGSRLTEKQFRQFLSDTDLYAEDVETGGSLGVNGLQPAISFDAHNPTVWCNAYVTPIPLTPKSVTLTEKDWQRVRRYIIDKYAGGI